MFPAAFDYHRPTELDEALALLADLGDEAKVLAGGQSLLPLMKYRLAAPETLIDVGRIPALRGVAAAGDALVIGAATTHQEVIESSLLRERCGALATVVRRIGDPQVRHRGTIGGALAHGDAAGDLPALARALELELVVANRDGQRTIAAADFFTGHFETALNDDELVLSVRVPVLDASWSWAYQKFAPVSHAWAVVGACVLVRREAARITDARIGLTHMGAVPHRATASEQALVGRDATPETIAAAAELADRDTAPPSDSNADAGYRRHLARVLTARALGTSFDGVRTAEQDLP